jgi:hypothetical protein
MAAYIPGYEHDIFISYAHGDNQTWIDGLVERLKQELREKLGSPVDIWVDKDSLRRSVDFQREIPDSLRASGVFLLLPSPSYITSRYCVDVECRGFEQSLANRRSRFTNEKLTNALFAVRCPILPVQNNEHYQLLAGLTDIEFCDKVNTFPIASPEFDAPLRRLVGELVELMRLMRNDATPVFIYEGEPTEDIKEANEALRAELTAQGYGIVPDRRTSIREQLLSAHLSVFLLGSKYDEGVEDLMQLVADRNERPWVVWAAPEVLPRFVPEQLAFLEAVRAMKSSQRTELPYTPQKLKEEVLAILKPDPAVRTSADEKARIYVVYNIGEQSEALNAGRITRHFRREFDFEYAKDRAAHTRLLSSSDGVLLVWGTADQRWCEREFAEIVQATSRGNVAKALCVFDPKGEKQEAIRQIREGRRDVHIVELFGPEFDPESIESFFAPIRRVPRGQAAAL